MSRHHGHPSRRPARILAGLAATLAALSTAVPAALAQPWPGPGRGYPGPQHDVIVVRVGGMPGWHIALIALTAAAIAAVAAIWWDRARTRHRYLPATAEPPTAAAHDDSTLPTVTLGPGRW